MEQVKTFALPVFQIHSVISTLEKDGIAYAHLITAKDKENREYTFRERRGLPVQDFIGKPVECVLEIIEAKFLDKETDKKKLPDDIFKGKYVWSQSAYKFIPELVEMIEGHQDEENYEYDEDEYDRIAGDYFDKWGVSGLGLEVYQDKPMVETENGVFLFNEYRNEKAIEEWQLNDPVYFRPKELLLRGFKPYSGKWERKKTLEEIYNVKDNEMLIVEGHYRIID
jgi:hypothetical protein